MQRNYVVAAGDGLAAGAAGAAGVVAAAAAGAAVSAGLLAAVLDADEVLEPERLSVL